MDAQNAFSDRIGEFPPFTRPSHDPADYGISDLAKIINLITDDRLSDHKALMYAGWISEASRKYGVNPLEIIALIKVESDFKERSINWTTGDYGLGQINWKHWGKHNELTPQDLLDPMKNILLTCQVYKFFGMDFGRYHRGNGIQCEAHLGNVHNILSALNAFAEALLNEG